MVETFHELQTDKRETFGCEYIGIENKQVLEEFGIVLDMAERNG